MQSIENPMQTLSHQNFAMEDWRGGYRSQPEEFAYWIDEVEGQIPPELEGTYFRNGPGLLDIGGYELRHPFDGDGMINAIALSKGRAFYRNRFVRTEGYVAEQKARKPLFRGVFGTQKPGGWFANAFDLRLKNIANTNIIHWGGKLLALWEAAEPHRLDPHTLETLGLEYLDGALQAGSAFAAHPKIDPSCDRLGGEPCLVNFAVKPGLSTTITLYEFNPLGQLINQHSHSVAGFAFLHDFAITPHYAIFFQNPVTFNPLPYVLGLKGAAECIEFNPKAPTRVILIPRSGKGKVKILETDPCFVFHHANAFEQEEKIYIDSICYTGFPTLDEGSSYHQVDFSAIPAGQLWRFTLDLETDSARSEQLIQRCCEFPSLHPAQIGQPYRFVYLGSAHAATGNAPLQAVLKHDLTTGEQQIWSAAPKGFTGEPLFIPRPGATADDDGWLLILLYDAERRCSELAILSAQSFAQGPIARLKLRHHVPYGLHGSFTHQYFGPHI
ncbi:carotenoid oxygenase family protein [Almyronema epifaneia]|uniref:Carotenoid oxygenase family protein n=1 Tax=Almyronema epifaneia S1 TaxID=2991925 RepID=A0ABW6IED8_9CYAN